MWYAILISFFITQSNQVENWELKKEKNGIEVYTRTIKDTNRKEFRAVTTIQDVDYKEIVHQLMDVSSYPDLFPECKHSEYLKIYSPQHEIHYVVLSFPWPLKDRDAIYEQSAHINHSDKSAMIKLHPRPEYTLHDKRYERLKNGEGHWEIKSIDNSNVRVIYQFQPDAGGNVPLWLVNATMISHPYETLVNLITLLRKN